jgi:hypothetical protein
MKGLNRKEYWDSILDEQEQTHLQRFVENEGMYEAVRKALLYGLYQQGTLKKGKKSDTISNIAFGLMFEGDNPSNEKLGEKLRALWEGINYVEGSLEDIKKYSVKAENKQEKINEAR